MVNDVAPADGLRARKRAATRAAIERTAIALTLEHGYDDVTVEMICDASEVSPRTFFNYFGSKERVILGEPLTLSEADAQSFVHQRGDDVVLDLVSAMAAPLFDERVDADLLRARFRIITATPVLLGKQMEWMTVQEHRLTELVLHRFRREGRSDDPRDEAAMVVAVVFAVLRFTLLRLYAEGEAIERGRETGPNALRHAVTLLTRVLNAGPN